MRLTRHGTSLFVCVTHIHGACAACCWRCSRPCPSSAHTPPCVSHRPPSSPSPLPPPARVEKQTPFGIAHRHRLYPYGARLLSTAERWRRDPSAQLTDELQRCCCAVQVPRACCCCGRCCCPGWPWTVCRPRCWSARRCWRALSPAPPPCAVSAPFASASALPFRFLSCPILSYPYTPQHTHLRQGDAVWVATAVLMLKRGQGVARTADAWLCLDSNRRCGRACSRGGAGLRAAGDGAAEHGDLR